MMPRRKVFVFDLDDTLHMRAEPFSNAVKELYSITDAEQIKNMFTDFRAIGVAYFHQWDAGTISEQEMYIRRTIDTFALYGYTVSEEESLVFHQTYEKYLQQIRPAEGIGEALQAASDAGIRLGILTNGSPIRQRNKIRALGLTRWIPEEMIAEEAQQHVISTQLNADEIRIGKVLDHNVMVLSQCIHFIISCHSDHTDPLSADVTIFQNNFRYIIGTISTGCQIGGACFNAVFCRLLSQKKKKNSRIRFFDRVS